MRYIMQQKWFALGQDFYVKNEREEEVYFVDERVFFLGDQLSIQDMQGHEVASISQRLLSWGPTYELFRGGDLYATVKKQLCTLFHCRFDIDIPGPHDLEATGDFWEHEYEFRRHGETVARVSKRWFSFADTYGIDVAEGEDDVIILASAVVIDLCCHDGGD